MDYRELCLLWAARETGLIETVMFEAGTVEDVAEKTGVTERSTRITLEAMVEMGFLERLDDEYEATNRALGLFTKTDVRSVGSVPHRLDCLSRWIELPKTMRTGSPPDLPDDWTTNFMGAMATVEEPTVRSCVTEAVHEHPDAERVLDVGGGPGTFATEFARRGYETTLVDQPDVIDIDSRFLEHEPVVLAAGDVTDSLPTGFDIVFCSRVAHALGPDENRQLLANAFDALEPGGVAVFTDQVRGRAEGAALMGAHMLAQTENGDTYTANEFENWFASAGFVEFEIRDIPGTNQQAIVGHRPRN
ncbi:class I SAM-dependent methyltransferase [Haladaptatus caseinilyticus]|uniref:class I SAM-dependent methyltransferase n=1 Tax=Haladaptatus caseinilyticus TaxID=2993314 RepID=UPI00224A9B55|nr:class I SAM-dependent methyltransferase [Haladaptatus caseinilyticus]